MIGFYAIWIHKLGKLATSGGNVLNCNTYADAVAFSRLWPDMQAMVVWVALCGETSLQIAFIHDGKWEALYDGQIDKSDSFKPTHFTSKGAEIYAALLPDYTSIPSGGS